MTCKHGKMGPEWCDQCDSPAQCAHGRLWPVAACAFCDAALVERQRERLGGSDVLDKLRRREVDLLRARADGLEVERDHCRLALAKSEADARAATERVERITWEARGAPMKGEMP